MRHFLIALVASATIAGTANAAVLFTDGFSSDSAGLSKLNFTGFTNWTVTGAVDLVNEISPFGIVCADACVDLAGSPGLGVLTSTPIALQADKEVQVSFTLSGNQRIASDNNFIASVSFLPNNPVTAFSISGPAAFTAPTGFLSMLNGTPYTETVAGNRSFVTYSYRFKPTVDGAFTMSYGATSATNPNIGLLLGSVLVTSVVPEPAAWAMMIGGFGMAGAILRRRRAMSMTSLA